MVFFQLAGNGRLVDAEGCGDFALITILSTGFFEQFSFDALQGLGQGESAREFVEMGLAVSRMVADLSREIGQTDQFRIGHHHQPFANVHEFADISRVGVSGQGVKGGTGQAFAGAGLVVEFFYIMPDQRDESLRSRTGGTWMGITFRR